MTYPNYTHDQMMAQYAKVNTLHAQIDAAVGDDPYREMTDVELSNLLALQSARDEAIAEMKYMERAISANSYHSDEQADF